MTLVEHLLLPAMARRGALTNAEIYSAVRRRARKAGLRLSPCWKATIRNTLQRHAKGHPKCRGRKPLFLHLDHGTWRAKL